MADVDILSHFIIVASLSTAALRKMVTFSDCVYRDCAFCSIPILCIRLINFVAGNFSIARQCLNCRAQRFKVLICIVYVL